MHEQTTHTPKVIDLPEAMPQYNALESQILVGLDNMMMRSLAVQKDLEETPSIRFGAIDKNGEMTTKYFDIDANFVGILQKTMMNRHAFYIAGNEKLEEAARAIRDVRLDLDTPRTLESHDIVKMWEVGR